MAKESELVEEIKGLNKNLKELKNSGKHMIYSANPLKFGFFNFIAGIFHSLGTLFGYVLIFGVIAYLLSQANLGNLMSKWVENTLQQVNWNKVVPAPQVPNQGDLEKLQQQMPQRSPQQLDQQDLEQLQKPMNQ